MALTFSEPSNSKSNLPSNPPEKPNPAERQKMRQQERLKRQKEHIERRLERLKTSLAEPTRLLAFKLKTADEIDYQEFIRTTGNIGLDQGDIETIVTVGRGFEVILTGRIEAQLNNLIGDIFDNRNFEGFRLEGGKWIITFRG